ncbi:hypothetical protein N7530_003097 [Penicillium desertorum]|uniref:Uncharacterized protein n=1 Tax=Penicillium desertorum TaxID=1303715 RepID=A0A9W9WVN2_9EURO|nr:hypothetical protein N7530_003097 [Penicillium desertorum]
MPLGASTQSHHFLVALKTLQSAIYDLTGLKLIKALNQWVARRSINNFVDDPTWDWPNETAVVTGGSSGIGAEIVRELAKRKIKTIILDINKQFQNWRKHGDPSILINYLALLRGLPSWIQRIVQTMDPDPLALANI